MHKIIEYGGIVTILALSFTVSVPALAQTAGAQKMTAAQALYQIAVEDMRAKKYEDACRKLKEAARLHPGAFETRLTLGTCYEFLGKFASAWSEYKAVERLATTTGQANQWPDATNRASALEKKLATLTIRVPAKVAEVAGLEVALDGQVVERARWSVPIPVDAGMHRLVATASGHGSKQRVRIPADGAKITVDVRPLEALPSSETSGQPAKSESSSQGQPSESQPGSQGQPEETQAGSQGQPAGVSPGSWQKPVALVTMGLGVVGVGVGAALGSMAIAKKDESNADNHCDAQNYCDPTGLALRQRAVDLGNAATVVSIVGAVALSGGIVLWAMAPHPSSEHQIADSAGRYVIRERQQAVFSVTAAVLPGAIQVKGAW